MDNLEPPQINALDVTLCPRCGEWVKILDTTPDVFVCPWCGATLRKQLSAYTDQSQRERMIVTLKQIEE